MGRVRGFIKALHRTVLIIQQRRKGRADFFPVSWQAQFLTDNEKLFYGVFVINYNKITAQK